MKREGILNTLVIAVFVTLLFTGCPPGAIDVTGSWRGPMTIEGEGEFTLSAELNQSGSIITGTADISYYGIPFGNYDIDALMDGNDIEGDLIGASVGVYDIEFTATVNDASNSMDGDFYIPDSDSEGSFEMDKE